MRYLSGVGVPSTETPGGELVRGTIDWGSPETVSDAEYAITIGDDEYAGVLTLNATTTSGPAAQLVYGDAENGIVLTAVSADGPFSLDAAHFVDSAGFGGFEFWTITDTASFFNRFHTITAISASPVPVPEPWTLGVLGAMVLMIACRLRVHAPAVIG
jgi:hypothetical protein